MSLYHDTVRFGDAEHAERGYKTTEKGFKSDSAIQNIPKGMYKNGSILIVS